MTDLKKLQEILGNQSKTSIKPQNWGKCEFVVSRKSNSITLKVPEDSISFVFSAKGRFKGLVNWKE